MRRKISRSNSKISQNPVAHEKSIAAAFERQINRVKICSFCDKEIPVGVFRSHRNTCEVKIDEDECMITQVITRVEKIGSPIILDDSLGIKQERSTSEEGESSEESLYDEPSTSARTQKRSQALSRRSSRIKKREPSPNADEVVIKKKRGGKYTQKCKLTQITREKNKSQDPGVNIELVSQNLGFDFGIHDPEINEKDTASSELKIKLEHLDDDVASPHDKTQDGNACRTRLSGSIIAQIHSNQESLTVSESSSLTIEVIVNKEINLAPESQPFVNEDSDKEDQTLGGEKYFVKFINKMLEKVVIDNCNQYGELFWGENNSHLEPFKKLKRQEGEIFMRLFLRKRQWLYQSQLEKKYSAYKDIDSILSGLEKNGFLERLKSTSLDEILCIATSNILHTVAKTYKLDYQDKNSRILPREEIIISLKKVANNQRDLFSKTKGTSLRMITICLKEMGNVYRIPTNVDIQFKALLTLYSPSETNSAFIYDDPKINIESVLFKTLLEHENKTRKFPAPDNCKDIIQIYRNYSDLKEYVQAKEMEIGIAKAIYNKDFNKALELGKDAQDFLLKCDLEYWRSFPPSIRRFTTPTVYIRTLANIATLYEKQKNYEKAVIIQRFILKNEEIQGFNCDTRGTIWERLSLNLEAHLKERTQALEEIEIAVKDPHVKEKDLVTLQDRALKLTKDRFEKVINIKAPIEKKIKGAVLHKNLGDSRQNRFVRKIEDGSIVECSVEEIARRHYLQNEGMSFGVHAEGSIWHTVFGILFFDIIFNHSYEDAWYSEIQLFPIDLNYPEFHEKRKYQLELRLEWFSLTDDENLLAHISSCWEKNYGVENSEVHWDLFESPNDLFKFIKTCPKSFLIGLIRRLTKDYRNTRSGFPDLTLWNPDNGEVIAVEVKGPGDRLSSKQRLWLQYFTEFGIRAEVCYVTADRQTRI